MLSRRNFLSCSFLQQEGPKFDYFFVILSEINEFTARDKLTGNVSKNKNKERP